MVIDEIQLVPELLQPIKVAVDLDPTPGRYLTYRLVADPRVADASGCPTRPDGGDRTLAFLTRREARTT